MKACFASLVSLALLSGCSPKAEAPTIPAPVNLSTVAPRAVTAAKAEIGCAMCVFGVAGAKACTPAIRIDGTVLALEGYTPKSEHALCNGAEAVVVDGAIHADRFVATRVEPAPAPAPAPAGGS